MNLTTPQPARHEHPTTRARALAYVAFERPDLDEAERFLTAFGLVVAERTVDALYLRGSERTPYVYVVRRGRQTRFTGLAFEVDSREELLRLAELPGASPVEPCDGPGGGERVRLRDPSGFAADALFGRTLAEAMPRRAALPVNTADATPRVNATQRPPQEPPPVLKLGHVVLELANYQATCAFYTQHFGLVPSDVQVLPDGSPAVAFLRLDRGAEPTDHHTLALAQGIYPAFAHAAFELVDLDAVGVGERVLRAQGFTHAWGIGRHILGSQIFDYWQDPWGDKHEHYTDGDVLSADVPLGVHAVSREAMAQWGPPMPRSFTAPNLSPGKLVELAKNLRTSPDLSARKVAALARIFG